MTNEENKAEKRDLMVVVTGWSDGGKVVDLTWLVVALRGGCREKQ